MIISNPDFGESEVISMAFDTNLEKPVMICQPLRAGEPPLITIPLDGEQIDGLPNSTDFINFTEVAKKHPKPVKHFKGMVYQIVGSAFSLETEKVTFIYKPLYDCVYPVFTRHKDVFFDTFHRDGKDYKRFIEIELNDLTEQARGYRKII